MRTVWKPLLALAALLFAGRAAQSCDRREQRRIIDRFERQEREFPPTR